MKKGSYYDPEYSRSAMNHDAKSMPTHKSVLLERWAKDTREMAIERINLDTITGECTIDHDGRTVYYRTYDDALDGEIAYLNSAAEVGK